MTHPCRGAGTNANRRQLQSLAEAALGGVVAAVLAGMVQSGLRGIRADMAKSKAQYKEPKVLILLAEFHKQFPDIRAEIIAYLTATPGESQLKELLFNILQETQNE